MKKILKAHFRIAFYSIAFSLSGFGQVTGDFQTKSTTGNWSNFNSWNRYNGSAWVAATAGQIPGATSSVFVQAGHVISVDNAMAICNDLNLTNTGGGKLSFSSPTSVLNVKGNMIISGTANCFGTWATGARLVFSGTGNQSLPANLGSNSVLDHIEVNKVSGTLTSGNSFRFNTFTLTSGNFTVASGGETRGNSASAAININGGVWNQTTSTTRIYDASMGETFPIGTVTINAGAMNLATSNKSGGFRFSTINIINGGTLTFQYCIGTIDIGTSIFVDATSFFNTALESTLLPPSVTFDGAVNYNHIGIQTIAPATYNYLRIGGTGQKTLDAGTTIIPANGTLEMAGLSPSPTLVAGGSLNVSSTGTNLIYSGTASQEAGVIDWNGNFQNVFVNNIAGVSMPSLNRTIRGSLHLENGTFNIGTNGTLVLDGAALNRTNGFITGTISSDLTLMGTTGGSFLFPVSGNINLHNITISGTRTLVMDGIHNISLSGLLNIGPTATYDNGGESQLTNGGGAVEISGTFINRDKDNFSGTNGAITSTITTLHPGSTIEYGRAGNQVVSARSDYSNIIFSGSGIKLPANAFIPSGTLTITGTAIVDASGHNIGDGTADITNFTMNGGRLILGTGGTQPMMNGNYDLTGGVIEFSGGSQSIRSKNYQNIEVTGTGVGNSTSHITLNTNGTFTVRSGGIFTINDNSITGSDGTQTVTVETGGIFRTGNNEGFNGFTPTLHNSSSIHENITNIIIEPGSTVEYIRNGDQPITNAGGLIYQNLNLTGSGHKTAPPGILTVQGNLSHSGTPDFLHNNGSVLLNGTGAQSFAGLFYNNLILTNNTKTTDGSSTIADSLKINSATTLSISAPDTIILHSDASKTARVAQIDGIINYNGSGKFLIERYIPARKAWRFLAVPVNTSQTIKDAWQEGATNTSDDPNPGYGIQITSNRATWSADGFDYLSTGGPSMKTYDPANDTYTGITTTNSAFDPTSGGYMTFIRGNRASNNYMAPVSSTTLRTAGQLYSGNQPPINLNSGEIIPVNNPFASALDLRKLSSSGNVFFYVWDPNRGGEYGFGGFQTLSLDGSDYDVVPGGGSYGTINNFIESGQAFFASTLGAGTALVLKEDCKANASFPVSPFAPLSGPGQKLRINLYSVNNDGSKILSDGIMHQFAKNYNNSIDGMDALKFLGSGENISINSNDNLLTVERRLPLTSGDTIFLYISGLANKDYRFEIIASKLNETGLEAWLEDTFLNTRTSLNLNETTSLDFNVDGQPGSALTDRFRIVFKAPSGPLPVDFTAINAYLNQENIHVEWKVENENGIKHYDVERSGNRSDFRKVGRVEANENSGGLYQWIDKEPMPGTWFYRIKSEERNGLGKYSKVVVVKIMVSGSDIIVYPNPVDNNKINFLLPNQPLGKYKIRLFNSNGQVILEKDFTHTEDAIIESVRWNGAPVHGLYRMQVTRPDSNVLITNVEY